MDERGKRTSRTEWQKRVARWRDSGLSADEFAAEIGVNAGTLRQWKYTLNRIARGSARRKPALDAASFVEVQSAPAASESTFQLELGADRRLHIPSNFDAAALGRLLSLLERP
jgi:transcriptional regulator with XRE-family HTH domain